MPDRTTVDQLSRFGADGCASKRTLGSRANLAIGWVSKRRSHSRSRVLISRWGNRKKKSRPKAAYFGGCSSPLSQPVSLSVFKESSRLHSKHRYVRCPLSRTGNVAPQTRQVGRAVCPMVLICRLTDAPVHSKENATGRMSFQSFLIGQAAKMSRECHKSRIAKSRRRLASVASARSRRSRCPHYRWRDRAF